MGQRRRSAAHRTPHADARTVPHVARAVGAPPRGRVPSAWSSSQPGDADGDARGRSLPTGAHVGGQLPLDDLIQALCRRASAHADQSAFVFLLAEHTEDATLTYARLERRARAIGAYLQQKGLAGQRVILAYPHGLEFIAGFFGCLFAGCTAVPTPLPHRRTLDRFWAIAADAGAPLVLSTSAAVDQCRAMARRASGEDQIDSTIPWLASSEIPDALAETWEPPVIAPDAPAMLQYTSGSTSQPKGVMLSHANLVHNTRAICTAFGIERELGMFWLPAYHDMGLVGGVLAPVMAGITNVLMSPEAFLQRPIDWLAAISRHRATVSGGPNFAYDLCVRRITDEQLATLDLSSWSLAFIGAEPIAPETLERFAARFAPCGFDAKAFYPCYGLAEATLMVSGAERRCGAITADFSEAGLTADCVEPGQVDAGKSRRMVSCGAPIGDLRVIIVDPETCTEAAPRRIGEIWVAGSSVGQGYWHNAGQTSRSFGAILSNTGEGPFLRTGDLGFVFERQLYITGRCDDLLIVRGLNHHPQDLEATARRSHPLLDAGFGAAFAIDHPEGQRLALVHEVMRHGNTDFAPVLQAARTAVLAAHGLTLHSLVLVRSGTIPKTSSGKVQRRACRSAFLAGELKILAEHRTVGWSQGAPDHASAGYPIDLGDCPAASRGAQPGLDAAHSSVLAIICQHALALGGAELSDVSPDTPLAALGLDSLRRVELAAMVEKSLNCRLPDKEFNPEQTLGALAYAVGKQFNDCSPLDRLPRQIPLSHYIFNQFPEYRELKRYEHMLTAVAGESPYFRVDPGADSGEGGAHAAKGDPINFSLYDYLGMAHDRTVADAAKAAIDRYGTGAGASRLICGDKQVHRDLERALASFLGTQAALVFVSGHATNVTTIGHLLGPEDLIVHDVLAHNSIIQGAQLSGATRRVFAHNDWMAMDAMLGEMRHRYRRVLIAIEGAYSMDGDFPDLPRFVELKRKHHALMLVDEAHSLGTMGATGRGIGEHWGVCRTDVDLWMGTLSKSLASCGGYIAGSAELVEYLAYTAPGFVYSVGMTPSSAASALAALSILQAQPLRVARLGELGALFLKLAGERGLNTGIAGGTPVIPVIVGNSVKSLRLSRALFDHGFNVQPILHPAVPEQSARLRFFITTNHTERQIRDAVNASADMLAML